MSEAIRSYRSGGQATYSGSYSRGGWFRRIVFVLVVGGLIWLYWTTRDTHPIERLVPGDQTFHLQADHLLASRMKAANSPLWNLGLIPQEYSSIPGWLGNDFGLPEWVLNNLVSDVCHVSGKDFNNFSDLLVVTRMSRVGCLIERYHRFVDGIQDEYAGGLELRRMVDSDMYYAVRGRTLIFSPSREALIACLSQRREDAVNSLEGVINASGGDVQGKAALPEDNPLGKFFEEADFALTFSPDAIVFACRGAVRPPWRESLETLTRSAPSSAAVVPTEGSVVLAGNFGVPLPDVWRLADDASEGALRTMAADWPLLQRLPETPSNWDAFLEGVSTNLGNAFYLRWTGFDLDAVVPLPKLDLVFPRERGGLASLLEAVPVLENGAIPNIGSPFRDPETGLVHCPLGWGGIAEPVIGSMAGGVRMALHPRHVDAAQGASTAGATPSEDGQLFIRVRPAEALELIRAGGLPYAEAGLIRGHTPESFDEAMARALEGIQEVTEARLTARYENGALSLEIELDLGAIAAS